jgi:hypothetical protein
MYSYRETKLVATLEVLLSFIAVLVDGRDGGLQQINHK